MRYFENFSAMWSSELSSWRFALNENKKRGYFRGPSAGLAIKFQDLKYQRAEEVGQSVLSSLQRLLLRPGEMIAHRCALRNEWSSGFGELLSLLLSKRIALRSMTSVHGQESKYGTIFWPLRPSPAECFSLLFSVLTIDSNKRLSLRFAEWDKLGCGQLYILRQMGEKWLSPIGFNRRFCKANKKTTTKKWGRISPSSLQLVT